jgi:hypothetical protein
MQGFSDGMPLAADRSHRPPVPRTDSPAARRPGRRLRSGDLLELAREQDPAFRRRLIADFPKWGLLALAEKEGRGAGEGVDRYWPALHAVTFIQIGRRREDGTRRRSDLVNLPVLAWLMGGDQLVSLEQVRRAVTTWAEASRKLSGRRKAGDVRRTLLRYPQIRKLIDDGALAPTDVTNATLDALHARDNRQLAEVIARATNPNRELDAVQQEVEIAKQQRALDLIALGARALPDVSDELLLASRARYHALHDELIRALGDGSLDADGVQLLKDEAAHPCANLVLSIGAELETIERNHASARVIEASAAAGWQLGLHMQALGEQREQTLNSKRRRQERIKARRR